MSSVQVDIVGLVDGAALGAVRLDVNGKAVIKLHDALTVDEQASLLDELLRPGEVAVFTTTYPEVPAQRSALDDAAARVS